MSDARLGIDGKPPGIDGDYHYAVPLFEDRAGRRGEWVYSYRRKSDGEEVERFRSRPDKAQRPVNADLKRLDETARHWLAVGRGSSWAAE